MPTNQKPDWVAELIVDTVTTSTGPTATTREETTAADTTPAHAEAS